jgi:hypothetical protein
MSQTSQPDVCATRGIHVQKIREKSLILQPDPNEIRSKECLTHLIPEYNTAPHVFPRGVCPRPRPRVDSRFRGNDARPQGGTGMTALQMTPAPNAGSGLQKEAGLSTMVK